MNALLLTLILGAAPSEADLKARAALALSLALQSLPKPAVRPQEPREKVIAKPVDTARPGQHLHVCPRCGTQWTHGSESFGNVAAHTCPKCGAQAWTPYQLPRPVQKPAARLCPT